MRPVPNDCQPSALMRFVPAVSARRISRTAPALADAADSTNRVRMHSLTAENLSYSKVHVVSAKWLNALRKCTLRTAHMFFDPELHLANSAAPILTSFRSSKIAQCEVVVKLCL